jgi:hypothetical protein
MAGVGVSFGGSGVGVNGTGVGVVGSGCGIDVAVKDTDVHPTKKTVLNTIINGNICCRFIEYAFSAFFAVQRP